MRGQPGHNTRLRVRLQPSFRGMAAWMTSKLSVALICKLRGSLVCLACSFDMLAMGVCTTRQWQTAGRLVPEFKIGTVLHSIFWASLFYIAASSISDAAGQVRNVTMPGINALAELPETHEMLKNTLKDFSDKELKPVAAENDKLCRYPREQVTNTSLYYIMIFTGYSGFLHYLQLASHETASIGINVTKNEIQIQTI